MDASDRDWLRANRHRITVTQNDDGLVVLEFDDYEVFDATEDYLTEECDLEDFLIESDDKTNTHRIHFEDPSITRSSVLNLLDRM